MNIWEKLGLKSGKNCVGNFIQTITNFWPREEKKVADAKSGERNVGQDFAAEPDAGRKARR